MSVTSAHHGISRPDRSGLTLSRPQFPTSENGTFSGSLPPSPSPRSSQVAASAPRTPIRCMPPTSNDSSRQPIPKRLRASFVNATRGVATSSAAALAEKLSGLYLPPGPAGGSAWRTRDCSARPTSAKPPRSAVPSRQARKQSYARSRRRSGRSRSGPHGREIPTVSLRPNLRISSSSGCRRRFSLSSTSAGCSPTCSTSEPRP